MGAPQDFDAWLDSPRGRYLFAWEQRRYDKAVADLFGFNALQIGLSQRDLLRNNRMSYRFRCSQSHFGDVRFDGVELPFCSQSLDLVLLPHVLEFSDRPHQLLREVERVLRPDGNVIISGFNPYSLWGMRRSMSGNLGEPPWTGQYLSLARIKDWLSLLGMEPSRAQFGCYAPPAATEAWLRRWGFMESLGRRCWPFAGGAYVLQAVKRVHGVRMILPQWRAIPRSKKSVVPVTQRGPDPSIVKKDSQV